MHIDTPQARCRAAVACGDITPPVGIYHRMWGAALHDRATGVHRPLLATVLWLEPREPVSDAPRLIVTLDHCILEAAEIERIRAAVAQSTGFAGQNVQIALSHTHGAGFMSRSRSGLPGGDLIGPYLDSVAETVARLAVQAAERVEPVTITYATGRCSLAAQRDFFDSERGHFVCGYNPEVKADDTLLVARLSTEGGATLATIVNYACHPTTLAWDNTLISPDWIGGMREAVESATQAPCLFLQGASGDLGPREGFVGDTEVADRNGRQVAYAVLAALETCPPPGTRFRYAGPVLSGTWIGTWNHEPLSAEDLRKQEAWQWRSFTTPLPYRHDLPTLEETRANQSRWQRAEEEARTQGNADQVRDCRANVEQMTRQIARLEHLPPGDVFPLTVTLARLGDAIWIFIPGELYQLFQTELRARFPDHPIIVSTVSNDWQPGYLPAKDAYGKGIYQDVIACVAPGSLELLLDAVSREVKAALQV